MAAYQQAIAEGLIEEDQRQQQVIASFQRLADHLPKGRLGWFSRKRHRPFEGIYLYGTVGVGKTFLVDLFYRQIPYRFKARFHFHQFMQQVDAQLRKRQGEKNPLKAIAAEFSKTIRLLCLDEFMVHDIAYAMILAELFQALIQQGVVLVLTSNIPPDDLYLNGLQRARFLPAIELIKKHCEVMELRLDRDYRLGREATFDAYLQPLNRSTAERMEEQFLALAPRSDKAGEIEVQGRRIPYLRCAEDAVWFSFNDLCSIPRSQLDYLEIASKFDILFLSDVPVMKKNDTAAVILFIQLVDVLYDQGLHLVVSAEASVDELYLEGEMRHDFKRTASRLHEMQSIDYLSRHPKRKIEKI